MRCGLTSPLILYLVFNKQRGGRRGTAKRSSGRRNNRNGSSISRQSNSAYAVVPTLGLGRAIAQGFPDKILSKLRYHDDETLASTVGSIAKYSYVWNSTFDIDSTGTGHQPLYRDTFAGIYDQYAVISATAKITIVNTSSVAFVVGAVIEDDTTSSTSRDTLCEQNHGVHHFVPALTGAPSMKSFTMNWDCKRILNIDPYTSETYKTAVGSNPTEGSFLTVWGVPVDGTSTASVIFDIEFTQTVLWTELVTPTQS